MNLALAQNTFWPAAPLYSTETCQNHISKCVIFCALSNDITFFKITFKIAEKTPVRIFAPCGYSPHLTLRSSAKIPCRPPEKSVAKCAKGKSISCFVLFFACF